MKCMESIYRDYHSKVMGYIRGKVNNKSDAEDLTSKVFEKICRKLETFDDTKASLSTWIYTITRNTVTDHFRTMRQYEELSEESGAQSDETDALLNNEALTELANALLMLDERERSVVVLRYYDGYTLKEAANILGMSYANIKLIHSKSIKRLGSLMEKKKF